MNSGSPEHGDNSVRRQLLAPDVLAGLKDFQRATVDYVFQRLYLDRPPAHRFLVADEVGLGKTLVARGLIAKVDRPPSSEQASSASTSSTSARTPTSRNRTSAKLNVTGTGGVRPRRRASRCLPLELRHLKAGEINFVSFTPGTSFDFGDSSGRMDERALLYWLLRHAWGSRAHAASRRLPRAAGRRGSRLARVTSEDFSRSAGRPGPDRIDLRSPIASQSSLLELSEQDASAGVPTMRERFDELADQLRHRERA